MTMTAAVTVAAAPPVVGAASFAAFRAAPARRPGVTAKPNYTRVSQSAANRSDPGVVGFVWVD